MSSPVRPKSSIFTRFRLCGITPGPVQSRETMFINVLPCSSPLAFVEPYPIFFGHVNIYFCFLALTYVEPHSRLFENTFVRSSPFPCVELADLHQTSSSHHHQVFLDKFSLTSSICSCGKTKLSYSHCQVHSLRSRQNLVPFTLVKVNLIMKLVKVNLTMKLVKVNLTMKK